MSSRHHAWVPQEVKTKRKEIDEKLWLEALADIWELLVKGKCQPEILSFDKKPKSARFEVKDSETRSAS